MICCSGGGREPLLKIIYVSRVARWYILKPKIPIWVKFWSVLQSKILANFMAIWSTLLPFRKFYGNLVYFVVILLYFTSFNMLCQEKSGNPDLHNEQDVCTRKCH
jgi:hypothetical protein